MRSASTKLNSAVILVLLFCMLPPTVYAVDGSGSAGLSLLIAYGATTVLSLLLAVGYCALVREKNTWLLLLFISVVIVNLGYFSLAISKTLEEALLANRISYLGSVFLPLCMLMTIAEVCNVWIRPKGVALLLSTSIIVFLVASSPGYLPIYYKEVSLVFVDGVACLQKVYGPLHKLYLFYLLLYFGMMIGVIIYASRRKRPMSMRAAVIQLGIVSLNIGIWAIEQVTDWHFEVLAVSYIVSELVLLHLVLWKDLALEASETAVPEVPEAPETSEEQVEAPAQKENTAVLSDARIAQIRAAWPAIELLTARETDVLYGLLENKKRKLIAEELGITEHTVKKHTANIFLKMGVTNRAELFAKADEETPNESL